MWTAKEIWEAGRNALAGKESASADPAAPPPSASPEFDPSAFDFEVRVYRIHFKNGHSGEYDGVALAQGFPFDPAQVERVEPAEEVG